MCTIPQMHSGNPEEIPASVDLVNSEIDRLSDSLVGLTWVDNEEIQEIRAKLRTLGDYNTELEQQSNRCFSENCPGLEVLRLGEYPLKPPPGGSDCQRILTQACVDNMRQADERDGFERDRSGDEEYCTFLTSQQCDDTIYNPQDRDLNDWESRWRKTQNIVNQEETLLDYYTSRPGRRGGPRSDPHSGPRGGPYEDDPEGEKK